MQVKMDEAKRHGFCFLAAQGCAGIAAPVSPPRPSPERG
jgi:hypothetical protein